LSISSWKKYNYNELEKAIKEAETYNLILIIKNDLSVYKYKGKEKGNIQDFGKFGYAFDATNKKVYVWVKSEESYYYKELTDESEKLSLLLPHHELIEGNEEKEKSIWEVIKEW